MGFSRLALLALPLSVAAQAQYVDEPLPQREFTEAQIEAVAMPALEFDMAEAKVDDFEKYFYFHRPETDFATAYYDITECDALASGISFYAGPTAGDMASNMLQYGVVAGAIGGAIGGLMADAIFGSGERRKQRRLNMRNCMFYKGYDRYGLEKDLWQEFNFEEGLGKTEETERENKLLMQARVASGPQPEQERLAP